MPGRQLAMGLARMVEACTIKKIPASSTGVILQNILRIVFNRTIGIILIMEIV